jgi:hypothetical protein
MKLDAFHPGHIDFAVGVLRGVASSPIISAELRANIEATIPHVRGAARLVERLQRDQVRRQPAVRKRKTR